MLRTKRKLTIWALLFAAAVLAACAQDVPLPEAAAGRPAATETAPEPTGTPGKTLPAPSATPSSSPTQTALPSRTPSPTPTATPPHPLTIEYLRQQAYPESELVVEQALENGANYTRAIVSYRSEGLKIRALQTIPFGEPPEDGWPVIVFNHGYIPPEIYRTTERYVNYVAGFATNGYMVLRPDYRGHDQSEGEARGAYGRPDYTIDVLNAVAAVKGHPLADPDRIGMWGHSMGGYITLRAMVTDPDIKAGVIWAGVVGPYPNLFNRPNFTIDATPTVSGRGQWRLDLLSTFGSPEDNPSLWASLSANSYLEDISGPVQLHHGTTDEEVPFSVSQLLYDQMAGQGLEVEFYGYEGADHNLTIAFSLAMQRSIQFFDRYVKNAAP